MTIWRQQMKGELNETSVSILYIYIYFKKLDRRLSKCVWVCPIITNLLIEAFLDVRHLITKVEGA